MALRLIECAGAHPSRPEEDLVCGSWHSSPHSDDVIGNGHSSGEVRWTEELTRWTEVEVSGDDWNEEEEGNHCHDGETNGGIPTSHASEGSLLGRIVLLMRTA